MDSRFGNLSDRPVTWSPDLATYLIVQLHGFQTWRPIWLSTWIPDLATYLIVQFLEFQTWWSIWKFSYMDSRLGDLSDSPVTWIPGLATYLIVPLPGGRTWRCCRRRSRIPTRPRHPPHWGTCPRTGLAHHQSSLKDNQEKVELNKI